MKKIILPLGLDETYGIRFFVGKKEIFTEHYVHVLEDRHHLFFDEPKGSYFIKYKIMGQVSKIEVHKKKRWRIFG